MSLYDYMSTEYNSITISYGDWSVNLPFERDVLTCMVTTCFLAAISNKKIYYMGPWKDAFDWVLLRGEDSLRPI